MARILIVSSNVHKTLAEEQREKCVQLVKQSQHDCQVEIMEAGTYEIPFVINSHHHSQQPFDAYIALGLVLKANWDHFDWIMSHIKESFTRFALSNMIVGNGIVSAMNLEELAAKVASSDPCLSAYPSAFQAVNYLLAFKQKSLGLDSGHF